MFEVIPGILEKEWDSIEKKIKLVFPFARTVHIDLLDGEFAPNSTFLDPKPFKKYSDDIFLELHMMVDNPVEYLKPWADAGFKRFIGHIEKMPDQAEFVTQAKLFGEVGLALDGPTPLEELKVPLEDLDNLLFMTIEAGFSGQEFNPQYLEKIKKVREKSETIPIEVDGGINDLTIVLAKNSGVTRFAATSFIYNSGNSEEQFRKLQRLVNF